MIINLWPDGQLPGTCDHEDSKPVADLTPHLLWKAAESYNDGDELPTVLIIPGGGYSHRADAKGELIADWLNEHGFHAAVLRYRVSPWRYPTPQLDAIRAMRLLRHRAEELGIDANRMVALGGSAGGHLAASLALLHDAIPSVIGDAIDDEDPRPDLLGLIYPVISATDHCHQGSWQHLLGSKASWKQRAAVSLEKWADPECPPTFLVHSIDDRAVPIANAYTFATALADAGVPHQLYSLPRGGHGWKFEDPDEEPWYGLFQQYFMAWIASYWPDLE